MLQVPSYGELRRENAELLGQVEAVREAEMAAEQRLEDAAKDAAAQRVSSQKLLEQLLAEQRAKFDLELDELRQQIGEKSAREAREERLEMLRRLTTKRIMSQSLYGGWAAWVALWEARVYALGRLRQAAARLKSPEVSSAFANWVVGALVVRQARAAAEARRKTGQLTEADGRCAELGAEVAQLRDELGAVSEERTRLRERITELDGGATEAALKREAEEAKAKEERVELMRRKIGRRMLNTGLSRGCALPQRHAPPPPRKQDAPQSHAFRH